MPLYKFRISPEQDESIFRDIEIAPTNTFLEFHEMILKAFQFDTIHEASFYKSNESWHKGKEVSLNKKDECFLMEKLHLVNFIDDPHQKILYVYDYDADWTFCAELMTITDEKPKTKYPQIVRSEGIAPSQYGNTQPLIPDAVDVADVPGVFDERLAFDTSELGDDMGTEGEDDVESEDSEGHEEESETEDEFADEEAGDEQADDL